MPHRIGYPLLAGAAAALAWAGWPAAPTSLATSIRRIDVLATVLLLVGLPWVTRRFFRPVAAGRPARAVRAGGCAVVVAAVLVKTQADRFEYAASGGRPRLAGVWAGEIVFLVVIAAYVAGILAVTARRSPAGPAALVFGTGAGVAAGVIVYALPPVGGLLHVTNVWPTRVYEAARALAALMVLGVVVAAGLAAARRTSGRGSKLPLADARARQGVAAGLCAGAAAALVTSVLGIATVALAPHEMERLGWALAGPHLAPGGVYAFEASVTDIAAGHLLVLVFFPVLGAGLGAWGGLCAAGRPGQLPDEGGGGGGHQPPEPPPPPPAGRRHLDDDRPPAILRGGYLVDLPAVPGLGPGPGDEHAAPGRPDKVPVGAAARARRPSPRPS